MKNSKILLVLPPITVFKSDPTVPVPTPPLGLAYIAGYLESFGYPVEILDCLATGKDQITRGDGWTRYGLDDEKIAESIKRYSPDIVGITSRYTAYASDAHRVAKIVKTHDPGIPVVMGGAHASISPERILNDRNVDVVVMGEGELTVLDLVRRIEEGKSLKETPGTVNRDEDGHIIRNVSREYIEDLDSLPFPARHLLPMGVYFDYCDSDYIMRTPYSIMITSRGCPGHCVYCSIHSVWGHKWRARTATNVVDEIELLQKKYGIKEIHFLDDNIGASRRRLREICNEIIKRGIDIKWATPNGIAHWMLDPPLLDLMKRAGCYRVTFGIESGNLETRKFIGKTYKLDQAREMIQYANKIGLWTICTFILGFPYEPPDSVKDTVNFSVKSDTDFAVFYLAGPFPGTRLYDICKKEGLLDFDNALLPSELTALEYFEEIGKALASRGTKTKYFSQEELQELQSSAYKTFIISRCKSFLNPIRILRKTRSVEDLFYTIKIGKSLGKMVMRSLRAGKFSSQLLFQDSSDPHKKSENSIDITIRK